MTKGEKRWSVRTAVLFLCTLSPALRIESAKAVVPDGYTISSPEREEVIARMGKLLEVYTTRPTQYSPHAVRPQDEVPA